jgi:alkylated DNA nucleotide flippase Atl1
MIPCHRVIRKTGELGGYHWGTGRKRLILAWEAAKLSGASEEPGEEGEPASTDHARASAGGGRA